MAPNPTCLVSLHKKGESGHRDICEDEGRDQGNASTNQETPKVAGKPLEAKTDLEQSLPYKEPALWAPSSWTSGLQNYEATNVTSDP